MRSLIVLIFILLGGPGAANTPVAPRWVSSAETGIRGVTSARYVISDAAHFVLVAEAQVITDGGPPIYVVEIGQRWDGVHRYLRIDTAWRAGLRLPFDPVNRREAMCTRSGNCLTYRLGNLYFSVEMFRHAAERGWQARLLGPDGVFDVDLPAAMFAEALAAFETRPME